MSSLFNKNTIQSLLLALLLVLVFTLNIGGVFSARMMMDGDGMMTPCPFMGMTGICNMTPLEHLAGWQQMFTATTQEFATTALLLLLSLVIVFSFVYFPLKLNRIPVRLVSRYRYRERVFDPLKLAFARGILNPKLY